MQITARQLLIAIETNDLETAIVTEVDRFAVAVLVSGKEVFRLGCLQIERPKARVSHDGRSVEVFPSPGLPNGFEVQCETHEEAILIAETLDGHLETAYLDLVDPNR